MKKIIKKIVNIIFGAILSVILAILSFGRSDYEDKNDDIGDYYGCPNSKRIKKLNLKKQIKQRKI